MTKISISIETEGLNTTQATNLAAFLNSLGNGKPFEVGTDSPEPVLNLEAGQEERPRATRSRAKKVEVLVEESKAENVEVVEPETVAPPQEEESDDLMGEEVPAITIEQIRSLVSEKQAEHKESIRNKLKWFDAANVTALEKENYAAFYTFLKGL